MPLDENNQQVPDLRLAPRQELQVAGRTKQIKCSSAVEDLVDTRTKSPLLRRSGVHVNHLAKTKISLAGTEYSFPVEGQRSAAVMSAVDGSGNHVIEYRSNMRQSRPTTEIVISPSALTIPHVHLLVAVSSRPSSNSSQPAVVAAKEGLSQLCDSGRPLPADGAPGLARS